MPNPYSDHEHRPRASFAYAPIKAHSHNYLHGMLANFGPDNDLLYMVTSHRIAGFCPTSVDSRKSIRKTFVPNRRVVQ